MKSASNILILATNRTLTLSLLRCLRPLNARVTVLAESPYPVVQRSNACHDFALFDPVMLDDGTPALADTLAELCRRRSIDILLPCGIGAVLWVAEHRRELTGCRVFPGMSLETTQRLHNKWRFAQFLQAHGLPVPATRLIGSVADMDGLDLPFPVVAKPLELDASQGVTCLETQDALTAHVRREAQEGGLPLLVQEFVPGPDISLSVLAERGVVRACTIQQVDARDGSLEFIADEGLLDLARRLAAAGGLHGLGNFDLRLDSRDGMPRVFECNPRFYASVHAAMCCGVNFAERGIQMAFQEPLPPLAPCRGIFVQPERLLPSLLRGRLSARHFSGATRRGLRLELSDPVACGVRLIEKKYPALASRLAPSPQKKTPSLERGGVLPIRPRAA